MQGPFWNRPKFMFYVKCFFWPSDWLKCLPFRLSPTMKCHASTINLICQPLLSLPTLVSNQSGPLTHRPWYTLVIQPSGDPLCVKQSVASGLQRLAQRGCLTCILSKKVTCTFPKCETHVIAYHTAVKDCVCSRPTLSTCFRPQSLLI